MIDTTELEDRPDAPVVDTRGPAPVQAVLTVVGWAAILLVARVVGLAYVHAHDTDLAVGAVPWVGAWTFEARYVGPLLLAAAAAAAGVWLLPRVAMAASWRTVLAATALAGVALTLVLLWAGARDVHGGPFELGYARHIGLVDEHGVASYLRTYVERQPDLGGHLRAHPAGLVLALWAFAQIGLSGSAFQLTLVLLAGAASTVAVLVAAREVGGEHLARAAAPFVALAPVAVWRTNPDVFFGALALVGVALVIVATGRTGRRRDLLAVAGGLTFAGALFCTYGVTLLVLPAVVVAVQRRAFRALVVAAIGGAIGIAVPAAWGFWWLAGLLETRVQYQHSLAHSRGYSYWLLGNAATFLALVGPATLVGLTRLKGTALRVLVLAGLACPLLAGISGLSSAETERIWQPFAPLVLLAGGVLWAGARTFDLRAARCWLALQVVVALAFQATLQSPW